MSEPGGGIDADLSDEALRDTPAKMRVVSPSIRRLIGGAMSEYVRRVGGGGLGAFS